MSEKIVSVGYLSSSPQRLGVNEQILVTMALRTAVSVAAAWSTPPPLAIAIKSFIAESPLQTRRGMADRIVIYSDGIDGYQQVQAVIFGAT